jgi:hypothetical protein
MVSAIGCFVSSAITLLVSVSETSCSGLTCYFMQIFFPRSLSEYDNDRTSSKKPAVATRPSSPTSDVRHTHVSYAGKISTAYQTQGPSIESTPGLESATPRPAPTLVHGERIRMQSTTWNAQIAMHEPPATLPYPDAAYSYHQHMKAVTPNTERSQSPDSDLYRPPSHLHPYVRVVSPHNGVTNSSVQVTNFTSPIGLSSERPSKC